MVLVFLALPIIYAVFRWLFPVNDDHASKKSGKEDKQSSKVDAVMDNILNRRTVTPKDCNGKGGSFFSALHTLFRVLHQF